jgi:hypothetical protein
MIRLCFNARSISEVWIHLKKIGKSFNFSASVIREMPSLTDCRDRTIMVPREAISINTDYMVGLFADKLMMIIFIVLRILYNNKWNDQF